MLIQGIQRSLVNEFLLITLIMLFMVYIMAHITVVPTYSQNNNEDWIIDKNTVIENVKKHVSGNIIVKPNVTLVIANSIIYMDSEYNGELSIVVNKGGTLEIINSIIRSGTNKTYLFNVYGTLIMRESTLRDCGIQHDKPGLVIEGSDYTVIRNSLIMGNYAGITIHRSKNIEITSNKVYANVYGLSIANSRNILISNNRFIANSYDLYTYNSTSLTISNNYFEGGGLYIDRNINNVIINNEFKNTGISISGDKVLYYKHEFKNNIVNGKPLLYIFNKSGTIAGDIGMAIIVSSENVLIHNVSVSNTIVGIGLYFSSNIVINSSIIKDNRIGIEIKFSKKVTLVNSKLEENRMYGLKLYSSQDITAQYNNIVHNTLSGILVMDSSNIHINYNNLTENDGYGVYVQDSNDVSAEYNWWGSIQGPEYKEQSDADEPEEIYSSSTNGFSYEPWLQKPVVDKNIEVYYKRGISNLFPYILAMSIAIIILALVRYYLRRMRSRK